MENNSFEEIWSKLKDAKKIAMALHPAPDGDSFGSCTAMKYVLERDIGCYVDLVSFDKLADNFNTIPFSKEIRYGTDISDLKPEEYDLFVLMDYGSIKHYSAKKRASFSLPENTFIINLDHHPTNDYYGNLNYIDFSQPSMCSLLIDMFKSLGIEFDSDLSNRLLVGVCTDSGFFTYDTNPDKALYDAAFLVDHGADYLNFSLKPILYNQPLKLKKYFGLLINNLKFDDQLKCGYSSISLEDIKKLELNEAEVRLGINELQFVSEFQYVFTLADLGDHIKGSFRSKKGVDVSVFAKALGGGGHKAAASFSFSPMPLREAEEKVLEILRSIQKN